MQWSIFRLNQGLMSEAPFVSVIVPTRDRKEKLLRLLASVAASDHPAERLEVIVVDNASADGTAAAVRAAFPGYRLISPGTNLWSAGGRNAGAAAARGEFLFFVDDDNILDPACIRELALVLAADERLGVAGPLMMRFPERDVIWCAGGRLDRFGRPWHLAEGRRREEAGLPRLVGDIQYFPNAYMLKRSVFGGAPPHDTAHFPHNWNEQDLGARVVRAGYRLAAVTAAVTWHDVGYVSRLTRVGADKTYDQARSRVLFRRLYLPSFWQWLFFFAVLLPVSTVYYLSAFVRQGEVGVGTLWSSYVKGTRDGLTMKL